MTNRTNVSASAKAGVASAGLMPRKPRKIKPTETGRIHISFLLDAETAKEIDAFAERLASDDRYGRSYTRTDALRVLIRDALDALKTK